MVDGGEIFNKSEDTSKLKQRIKIERNTIDNLFKDALFWFNDDDEDKWKSVGNKRKQILKLKFKLLKLYDKIFNQLLSLMKENF